MQVIFTADPNIIGTAIRFFSKISWIKGGRTSHVALRYGEGQSNWMIESCQYGICPNWWNYFSKNRYIYKKFEVIGEDNNKLIENCANKFVDEFAHQSYDYGNLLGFMIIIILYKITGKIYNNFFDWPRHFGCSEAVYTIFNKAKQESGIDFMGIHDTRKVFPEELLRECENRKDLFKEII
jgi:hypothetical protein